MAYLDIGYRLYYAAENYTTGLTDVYYHVYKPSGMKLGPYAMTELNEGTAKGIYYDDFLDANMEGSYLFIANSISVPKQHEKSVFFENRTITTGWTAGEKTQIRDSLGVDGDKTSSTGGIVNYLKTQVDQIATMVDFLYDVEGGMWEIRDNQMIFYAADNVTEVMRFDLFDKSGVPAGDNVYKRKRV